MSLACFRCRRYSFSGISVKGGLMRSRSRFLKIAVTGLLVAPFLVWSARAQEVPAEYQQVLKSLARSGDFKANVLKVNVPRNDLHRRLAGNSAPTPFGLRGRLSTPQGDRGEHVAAGR